MVKAQEEPMKFYRRFAAHFSYDATSKQYEPIIACCDMKDNKLKVQVLECLLLCSVVSCRVV